MNNELRDTLFYSETRAIELLDSMYKEENNNDQEKIKEYAKQIFAILKRDDLYEYTIKHELINTVLLYSSIGYCGGCFNELKEWYKSNKEIICINSENKTTWNDVLTYKLYECWLYLFKNENTDKVPEIVRNLRRDQAVFEEEFLNGITDQLKKERMCFYLIGCYHLARVVEIIAQYKTGVNTDNAINNINYHFRHISECLSYAVLVVQNYCVGWLHAAAIEMIKNQEGGMQKCQANNTKNKELKK